MAIYSLKKAADLSGYSVQHLRRLCKSGKVAHVKRGGAAVQQKHTYYYFTEEQIKALFVVVPGENMAPRGPVAAAPVTAPEPTAPPTPTEFKVPAVDVSKTEFPL